MKWTISRKLPDSPTPQQDASDTIGGLFVFSSYISFPNQHHFPQILTRPRLKYTVE